MRLFVTAFDFQLVRLRSQRSTKEETSSVKPTGKHSDPVLQSAKNDSGKRPLSLLPNGPWPSFRDDLMDEILAEHPGLTREELDRQMSQMGF